MIVRRSPKADNAEYASFGKLSKQATEAAVADLVEVGLDLLLCQPDIEADHSG